MEQYAYSLKVMGESKEAISEDDSWERDIALVHTRS